MTLGEWIPTFIDAYKRDTIRPDSLYTQLPPGYARKSIRFRYFPLDTI